MEFCVFTALGNVLVRVFQVCQRTSITPPTQTSASSSYLFLMTHGLCQGTGPMATPLKKVSPIPLSAAPGGGSPSPSPLSIPHNPVNSKRRLPQFLPLATTNGLSILGRGLQPVTHPLGHSPVRSPATRKRQRRAGWTTCWRATWASETPSWVSGAGKRGVPGTGGWR